MEENGFILSQPVFADRAAMRLAGMEGFYTRDEIVKIPAHWMRFSTELNAIRPEILPKDPGVSYGVVYASTPMRYVTGVEVGESSALPDGWVVVEVPVQRYAVFTGSGGVEAMRSAWARIFEEWLPGSGYVSAGGPMVERYDEGWMRAGEFEIWIPVVGKG